MAVVFLIALILFQSASKFQIWMPYRSMATFKLFFYPLGIVYVSLSFPSFRSKEKTMSYLMLPASTSEKFIFEFLTRIIAFGVVMPILFWIVANLEGTFIRHYIPVSDSFYSKFPFSTYFRIFSHTTKVGGWYNFGNMQIGLFVLMAAFAGASYFSRSPLLKTLFTLSVTLIGLSLVTYLLYKGLNLNENNLSYESLPFVKNKEQGAVFEALLLTAINLALFSIAWFSLK